MGFEPTRAEPIGLAVQRLNHSATQSSVKKMYLENKTIKYAVFDFSVRNSLSIWVGILGADSTNKCYDVNVFLNIQEIMASIPVCFISNTVNEGLVPHFSRFHSRCLALLSRCLFSSKNRLVLLLIFFFDVAIVYFFKPINKENLYL